MFRRTDANLPNFSAGITRYPIGRKRIFRNAIAPSRNAIVWCTGQRVWIAVVRSFLRIHPTLDVLAIHMHMKRVPFV